MPRSVCALCLQPKELSDSHIIPNAYFKAMKRDNSGKLVAFDSSNESEAQQSIESWYQKLLCHECEQRFSKWETSSIETLRRTALSIEKSGNHGGLIKAYDYSTLRLFLLSILWRAAASDLPEFGEMVLPTGYQERLRRALNEENLSENLALNCRLMKIVDSAGVFTARNFENIAVSPSIEPAGANGKCTFIFGGYLVEYFVPRMPSKISRKLGVLKQQAEQFIPTIEMTGIPKLMALFVAGHRKSLSGKRPR